MKEVVKYANIVNEMKFKDFTAQDYDFLMMLCAKMKNQKTQTMTFSFSEIRRLSGYRKKDRNAFIENLKSMNRKLMSVTTDVQVNNQYLQFVLFPTFVTNLDDDVLTVSVNSDFQFILNDLTANFTRFELEEFVSLESKYAKTLYRLIKQYRTTGEYRVTVGEFRDLMGCPPSYSNGYFLRDVIQPAVNRLQQFFPLLKCTVIHARKPGAPVTGYLFTFQGEDRNQLTIDQGVDEVRKKANDAPDTKNRFNNFKQREYNFGELERAAAKKTIKEETEKKPEKRKLVAMPKDFEVEVDLGFEKPVIETEKRYVLMDAETGEIVDDAQGYGYKTAQGAHKANGWKKNHRDEKGKIEKKGRKN